MCIFKQPGEQGSGGLQRVGVTEVDLEQAHSWSWITTAAPTTASASSSTTASARGETLFTESLILSTSPYHPLCKDRETRNAGHQSGLAHTWQS